MCGIFGWWGEGEKEVLHRMADSLRHRGPDGEGFFYQQGVGMGMTRLAILDREQGGQPVRSQGGEVVVVCNGEIYNFRELKGELEREGYVFRTSNDVEVLPAAYEVWGIGFLEKLQGMFAIALFDGKRRELFLARDRCGQKPLYFTKDGRRMVFASELRALWVAGVEKRMNSEVLPLYLNLRYVPEPATVFEGVEILEAGCYWSSGSGKVRRWWRPETDERNSGSVEDLHGVVKKAVGEALVSDEPIAVHLSAGVDSSVLLAEIAHSGVEVTALTAGFGAASDESVEAGNFARAMGVEHEEVRLGPEDLRNLPRVVDQMEVPVGDALVVAFDRLAEATAGVGCKVALGGEGVDEVFAGYSFQKVMLCADRLGGFGRKLATTALNVLPFGLVQKMSAFPAEIGNTGLQKIRRYLAEYEDLSDLRKGIELRTLFDEGELGSLGLEMPSRELDQGGELFERHLRFQFQSWLQDWAIVRQERNTMAHSVEYRMPFLDHRLVEFGLEAPRSAKIRGLKGKVLWREMARRYYPEAKAGRVKQPFYFPVEQESYFDVIEELVMGTVLGDNSKVDEVVPKEVVRKLWEVVMRERDFLSLKKMMALVVLDLWMGQFA